MVTGEPYPGGGPDDERRGGNPEPDADGGYRYGDDGDTEYSEVARYDDIIYPVWTTGGRAVDLGAEGIDTIIQLEPSELTRRYLFPTEKFRGEWRRHWIHLAKRLAAGVVATFVLGYASGLFAGLGVPIALAIIVVIWVAVMGWVLWDVVEWYYDRFVLTNKRVMLIEGIISRRVAMMPLARVTDMKYTQSPVGRIFGYGTFELESAGQDQALRTVKNLPNPTDLYLQVVEEMYEPDAAEARRRPASVDDA